MKNKYFSLVLLVSLGLTGGLLQEPFRRIKGEALENVLRTFYIPSEGLKEWRDFVLNEFIEEIETLKIIGEKESRTGSGEEIRFFFSQKQERFWQNPQALPHIVFLYEGERERIGILSGPIFTADGLGVALLEDLPSEVVGKIKAKSNNFRGPVMKEERAFKIYLPWANDTQAKETWEREIKSRYLLERIFLNPRFYAGNKESDVHRLSLDASIFSLVPGEGRAIYLPDLGLVSREISISSSWLDLFMQEFAHHFYSANPQIFKEIKLAQRIKTLHPRI
ncbi:MAG: hypothetical protein NC821_04025, partial [Candidatus Omnitrophica bacterium]|nr:hypothetical protein [Candidatus Omnitrophota bacterium]